MGSFFMLPYLPPGTGLRRRNICQDFWMGLGKGAKSMERRAWGEGHGVKGVEQRAWSKGLGGKSSQI